jgi:hypothetical protein
MAFCDGRNRNIVAHTEKPLRPDGAAHEIGTPPAKLP